MKIKWEHCKVEHSDDLNKHWNDITGQNYKDIRDVWYAALPQGILLRFVVGTGGNVVFIPNVDNGERNGRS